MTITTTLPLTDRTNRILIVAHQVAREFNHDYLGTDTVLLAICRVRESVGAFVLGELVPEIESRLCAAIKSGEPIMTMGRLPQTPRLKAAFERAQVIASEWGHFAIGSEHLVCALAECSTDCESVTGTLLCQAGVTAADVIAKARIYCGLEEVSRPADELNETIRVSSIGPVLRALMTGRWVRLDKGRIVTADVLNIGGHGE